MENKNIIKFLAILAIGFAIVLVAIALSPVTKTPTYSNTLKSFSSQDEIKSFLKANSQDSSYYGRETLGVSQNMKAGAAAPTAAQDSAGSSSSASSYSKTNIQVQGVDEADLVKSDGKYIYSISQGKVFITEAYPATSMSIVSEINISASQIFLNKDKLIIFSSYSSPIYYSKMMDIAMPQYYPYNSQNSMIYIYDLSDKADPKLEQNISLSGNYVDSRMIGDYVYVISSKSAYADDPVPPIYTLNGAETKIMPQDVQYFDYPDTSYSFTSVSSINTQKQEMNSKVFLTGYSQTIFVSENNIYLTYTETISSQDYQQRMIDEVYTKIIPVSKKSEFNTIISSSSNVYEKINKIQDLIYTYSNSLSGNEKSTFDQKLSDELQNFQENIAKETEKTAIHKIEINNGNIQYKSNGNVPGHVLNQFSMDEYNNNFRIATTTGDNWQVKTANNVYVLDENLDQLGKLENLAEGEKIYSARFMQDRVYLVTFKSVDPLFVIDLSDSQDPKVLGYLKIPGWSDYLHPYDETHVIGIGKDADESIDSDKVHSEGAIYYTAVKGVKISLFDVSDVEHPVETAKFVIGERGTESLALQDHKAFLFDKEKGILVLPISLVENPDSYQQSWQGAYVLNIDLNNISLRGKITHQDNYVPKYGAAENDSVGTTRNIQGQIWEKTSANKWKLQDNNYGYDYSITDEDIDRMEGGISYNEYIYDYQNQIQRSLFMDDVLYTLSQKSLKANDLNTLEEINKVSFPFQQQIYPVTYSGRAIE